MLTYSRRALDDPQVQRRWLDPRLAALRVSQIRSYLLARGWQQVPPDRPQVLAFREPTASEEELLFQWVPDSESWREDQLARVYEVLAAVAEVDDRYAGDVLANMLRQPVTELIPANGPAAPTAGAPIRK